MSMFGLRPRDADLVDAKLPDHLYPVYTATWIELVARCKLPAGRKSVAMMLASFANSDGTNAYPSLGKLAVMAGLTENSARTHLQALEALELLAVTKRGGGRHNPTVYRLVRPDLTALPLVLDPDMEPIPAGAGFVPVAVETLPDSGGYPAETLPETVGFPAVETLPVSGGFGAVDNSAPEENPPDSAPKPPRFSTETLPTAGGDLTKTYPEPENLPGSSQVTASLGWRERGPLPPAVAALVGPPTPEPWISPVPPAVPAPRAGDAEPPPGPRSYAPNPPPRVVSAGTVTLAPTAAAADAFAILAKLPGGGEWYRARAGRELRREGTPEPTVTELAIRAAEILRRSNPETRSA